MAKTRMRDLKGRFVSQNGKKGKKKTKKGTKRKRRRNRAKTKRCGKQAALQFIKRRK